jgi:hypothetical protein
VDQEVAKTLGELELKLQELERELTSIGHRDGQATPKAPGTLIDEAVEAQPPAPPPVITPTPTPPAPPPPDPRRADAVEESRAVDLAELVRFRDKLARTMDELIDEYSRLLPTEPLPPRRPSG